MSISDEAVEAARLAVYKARWVDAFGPNGIIATDEVIARAALEAAAPHMRRTLSVPEELDALPGGSVVLGAGESVMEKPFYEPGWWFAMGTSDRVALKDIQLPIVVLYEPTP